MNDRKIELIESCKEQLENMYDVLALILDEEQDIMDVIENNEKLEDTVSSTQEFIDLMESAIDSIDSAIADIEMASCEFDNLLEVESHASEFTVSIAVTCSDDDDWDDDDEDWDDESDNADDDELDDDGNYTGHSRLETFQDDYGGEGDDRYDEFGEFID